jgi:protein-arginine kinase activator protein McsA
MDGLPLCTHCGFTWGEYRLRGLLGCPHCYASFGEALQGDLLWIHEALAQGQEAATASPSASAGSGSGSGSGSSSDSDPDTDPGIPERLARWREQLSDAVRREDYAAAAALQKRIREAERPER